MLLATVAWLILLVNVFSQPMPGFDVRVILVGCGGHTGSGIFSEYCGRSLLLITAVTPIYIDVYPPVN
jgi:hypothetical protein